MQLMLLAAGLGSRLWPLTVDRAKPAVPFLGRPLIAGLVDLAVAHGARRVVINTHHRPDSVRAALVDHPAADRLAFSHEEPLLGTAGGIALARDRGLIDPSQPLLVMNAKLNTSLDLRAIHAHHLQAGAEVTMVLKPNPDREHFREVCVEGDRVVGFGQGRIPSGPAPLLFTGVHVLSPATIRATQPRFSDTVADVYPPLIAAGQVAARIEAAASWSEFSTVARYLSLHQAAWGDGPRRSLSQGATVAADAQAEDVVLWEGARLGPGCVATRAVIGAQVQLSPDRPVKDEAVIRAALHEGPLPEGAVRVGDNLHLALPPPDPKEVFPNSPPAPRIP